MARTTSYLVPRRCSTNLACPHQPCDLPRSPAWSSTHSPKYSPA